ncbi:hypothetical protein HYU18_01710 [Candidatus Woesearchaeota archaeon]|nr:hypothetical protein [Candidatus Woesearchaeota archaeon]
MAGYLKARRFGKKGASMVMILRAFDIVIAAGLIVIMVLYLRNVKDDTFLEKTYLARDVGLLITTAYASPGDLRYCYYEVGKTGPEFDYKVENGQVFVKDDKGEVKYQFGQEIARPVQAFNEKFVKGKPFAVFEIRKAGGAVSVRPIRAGEASDFCKV